jgi:hypothetical protein
MAEQAAKVAPAGWQGFLAPISTMVQVVSVVAGVVISVLSFNHTQEKEADARRLEAAKPLLDLRQSLYVDAVKTAAVLANPDSHTAPEIAAARSHFRDLYVTQLSMVESRSVATEMVNLADAVDPPLRTFTPAQTAAYNLSKALRDTFVSAYDLPQ